MAYFGVERHVNVLVWNAVFASQLLLEYVFCVDFLGCFFFKIDASAQRLSRRLVFAHLHLLRPSSRCFEASDGLDECCSEVSVQTLCLGSAI